MPLDSAWGMHDGWGWVWGGLMMALFWGFVIWAVIVFLRRGQPHRHQGDEDEAIGLLRRRYAAGEMTREEYEETLAELRDSAYRSRPHGP